MTHPNIMVIAKNEFQGALRTDGDYMRLRGRPINLNELMREVNKRRAARGEQQILTNPQWEAVV